MRLDKDGRWLQKVRRVISPNCDARPDGTAIDLIVIHGISLPPCRYGGPYIDQLFTNTLKPAEHPYFAEIAGQRVSSHLLIGRKGDITQYVPFHLRAWHAGESTFERRTACNDFSIGIELEGCDEQPYDRIQYEVAAQAVNALMQRWPEITPRRVVGHCHIAPGRKTDPGPAF
ncbi:MAG: 1,6-anhydro-N-acetylmuramyl-L-alanine amidase AmpD, partial [Gammaproteobacteria bacterium]